MDDGDHPACAVAIRDDLAHRAFGLPREGTGRPLALHVRNQLARINAREDVFIEKLSQLIGRQLLNRRSSHG
jgi:hypothetical protein